MPFAQCGDLRARYELSGDHGTVLVFSNSLGTDISMWEPQLPQLTRRFRILRYDTRGHGQSTVTAGEYSIEQLGRDVLLLLDSLQLERVHFCGLSMGGIIGIWLGVNASHRLHRLALCNTAAHIGTKETWNTRIATVRKDGMKQVAAAVIERWFTPGFRAAFPEPVARPQALLENTPPDGYVACCAAIRDMDQRAAVGPNYHPDPDRLRRARSGHARRRRRISAGANSRIAKSGTQRRSPFQCRTIRRFHQSPEFFSRVRDDDASTSWMAVMNEGKRYE